MNVITMKLADLKQPDKNVRIHTEQQIREFERSVRMFGQIRPIVVDEDNVILAGNGLYETLLRVGSETADVYQYTDLTENQKKKLMIADNKIFSLGIENLDTLNSFLEDLQSDLDIPGYDSDVLRQMVSEAEEVTEKLAEYGTLDESEIQAIKDRAANQSAPQALSSTSAEGVESTPTAVMEEPTGESVEVRRFIICPKCGEKIWL